MHFSQFKSFESCLIYYFLKFQNRTITFSTGFIVEATAFGAWSLFYVALFTMSIRSEKSARVSFAYYGRRLGLLAAIVCLVWSVDIHGGLGVYSPPAPELLSTVVISLLMAAFERFISTPNFAVFPITFFIGGLACIALETAERHRFYGFAYLIWEAAIILAMQALLVARRRTIDIKRRTFASMLFVGGVVTASLVYSAAALVEYGDNWSSPRAAMGQLFTDVLGSFVTNVFKWIIVGLIAWKSFPKFNIPTSLSPIPSREGSARSRPPRARPMLNVHHTPTPVFSRQTPSGVAHIPSIVVLPPDRTNSVADSQITVDRKISPPHECGGDHPAANDLVLSLETGPQPGKCLTLEHQHQHQQQSCCAPTSVSLPSAQATQFSQEL